MKILKARESNKLSFNLNIILFIRATFLILCGLIFDHSVVFHWHLMNAQFLVLQYYSKIIIIICIIFFVIFFSEY